MEIDKLCGHQRAGGVLGVVEQLIDLAAGGRVGVAQDAGHQVGGHVLNQVHRVVQIQLVQHFPQLPVAEGADELLLVLLQIGEYLRRRVLGQQTEDQNLLVHLQLIQKFCDVHLVHFRQNFPQSAEFPLLNQLHQLVQIIVVVHVFSSSRLFKRETRKTTGSPWGAAACGCT